MINKIEKIIWKTIYSVMQKPSKVHDLVKRALDEVYEHVQGLDAAVTGWFAIKPSPPAITMGHVGNSAIHVHSSLVHCTAAYKEEEEEEESSDDEEDRGGAMQQQREGQKEPVVPIRQLENTSRQRTDKEKVDGRDMVTLGCQVVDQLGDPGMQPSFPQVQASPSTSEPMSTGPDEEPKGEGEVNQPQREIPVQKVHVQEVRQAENTSVEGMDKEKDADEGEGPRSQTMLPAGDAELPSTGMQPSLPHVQTSPSTSEPMSTGPDEEPKGEGEVNQPQREIHVQKVHVQEVRQAENTSVEGMDKEKDVDEGEGPHSQMMLPAGDAELPSTVLVETPQPTLQQTSSSITALSRDPSLNIGSSNNNFAQDDPETVASENAEAGVDCMNMEEDLTSMDSGSSHGETGTEENTAKGGTRKRKTDGPSDSSRKRPRPLPDPMSDSDEDSDVEKRKVKPRPKPKPKPKTRTRTKGTTKPTPNPKPEFHGSGRTSITPTWFSTIEQTVDGHLREVLMIVDDMVHF